MDYKYIENLAELAKSGNNLAKETLAFEFAPLIHSLSRKTFVNSYEAEDIKNECYKTLFKCVNLYNQDTHRFVAYATNAINNSVNNLIRISVRRKSSEGAGAFILDGNLEHLLPSHMDVEDIILKDIYKAKLKAAMRSLSYSEQALITYVYFKGYTLKRYAEEMGISYGVAYGRKVGVLGKLRWSLDDKKVRKFVN